MNTYPYPGRHPSLLHIKKNNVANRRKVFEKQAIVEEDNNKNIKNISKHSSQEISKHSINKKKNILNFGPKMNNFGANKNEDLNVKITSTSIPQEREKEVSISSKDDNGGCGGFGGCGGSSEGGGERITIKKQKNSFKNFRPIVPVRPPSSKVSTTYEDLCTLSESQHKIRKSRPKTITSKTTFKSSDNLEAPNFPPKPPRVISGSSPKSPSILPLYELLADTHSFVSSDNCNFYHVLEPLQTSNSSKSSNDLSSRKYDDLKSLVPSNGPNFYNTLSFLKRSDVIKKEKNANLHAILKEHVVTTSETDKPLIYSTVGNDWRYENSLKKVIQNKNENTASPLSHRPIFRPQSTSHNIEPRWRRQPKERQSSLQFDEKGYGLPNQRKSPRQVDTYTPEERTLLKDKMDMAYSILRPPNQDTANSVEDLWEDLGEHHLKRLEYVSQVHKQTNLNPAKEASVKKVPNFLFEYSLIVTLKPVLKQDDVIKYEPDVIFEWPSEISEDEKSIKCFCFPDLDSISPSQPLFDEVFSFMLTSSFGERKYCWCLRYSLPAQRQLQHEAVCIVSKYDEVTIFRQLLQCIRNANRSDDLPKEIIKAAARQKLPRINKEICIRTTTAKGSKFNLVLKRLPENKHSTIKHGTLVEKLPMGLLVQAVSSLLLERKLILIAEKISTLSACISSLCNLLFPFHWPHTIITALPSSLSEIIDSPSPFIIGILTSTKKCLNHYHLDDVLVVNLDGGFFVRWVGDEASILPKKIQKALLSALSEAQQDEELGKQGLTDAIINEAFMRMFVETCGHYRSFIDPSGPPPGFKREDFVKAVPTNSIRMFLDWFSRTSMFQIFVSEKGKHSRSYDTFEQRVDEYECEVEQKGSRIFKKEKLVNFFKSKLVKPQKKF